MKDFIPKMPWSVGRVLFTDQTRGRSMEQLQSAEKEEQRRIFSNFRADDQGRSRTFVAVCSDAEIAAFIVHIVNSHDKLKSDYDQLLKDYHSSIEENLRLTDQLTYSRARS